jgi:hypothetical protein
MNTNNAGNGILSQYLAGLALGRKESALYEKTGRETSFNRSGVNVHFLDGFNDGYLRGK